MDMTVITQLYCQLYITCQLHVSANTTVIRLDKIIGETYTIYNMIQYGKRPLGRPRRRWVGNIRTDLQEVGCGYMDWIGL